MTAMATDLALFLSDRLRAAVLTGVAIAVLKLLAG